MCVCVCVCVYVCVHYTVCAINCYKNETVFNTERMLKKYG